MNFVRNVLIRNARTFGSHTALVFEDSEVSHAELNDRVNRAANALLTRGHGKGSVTALFLGNSLEFVDYFFASHKIGGILTPVNVRYKTNDLRHQLRHSGAQVLVFDAGFADIVNEARAESNVELFVCAGDPVPDWAVATQQLVANAATTEPPQVDISESDPSAYLYTSGTTGASKGVPMFYWGGLYLGALETNMDVGLTKSDVSLCVAPLFHQAAHCFVLLMPLMVGSKVVILPKFDPDLCVSAIARNKVTFSFLVPTMSQAILSSPALADHDTRSFRKLLSSGSALSEPLKHALQSTFPEIEIFENYGATESFNSTRLLPADTRRKQSCAGLPIPSQQVRIVDTDNEDVPVGAVGEIIVKGPATFTGYLPSPEHAEDAIDPNGWFHTGDLGRFDEEGYVYVVGRAKEMIISGGENILPKEIEDTILELSGVKECAVVGIPDSYWGETVCAIIVPDEEVEFTNESIIEHCSKYLADYKKPRRVEFRDSLPRNPAGKVVKAKLKESILYRLNS